MKFIAHTLFILLCFCPRLHGQSTQYENQIIEKIDILPVNVSKNPEAVETAVRARMKTKAGAHFSQTDFDSDLKRLVSDFDHVEPKLESVNGKLNISLKVWPKPTIRMIRWQGNKKVKTTRLQYELDVAPLSIFDRKGFNQAFHKLKAYYIRKGFFEAELDYCVKPDPKSNEVEIEITINEGRSGHVSDIKFINFTNKEKNDILEQMITKRYNLFTSWLTAEGTYNEEAVRQDEFVILNYLQDAGYADAKVSIDVRESKKDKRIELIVTADKGEKYTVGKVTFEGNCIVDDVTIRKLIQIKEGDNYSPETIRESARNIMDYYGRKGYIDTLVDFEPKLEFDKLSYTLHFTIEEGEQFRIGLIKIFGNSQTQSGVILHETLLIPGEVFNANKLKVTEERLRNIGFFKNVNVYAVRSDGPCGLGDNFRDVHIEVEETSTGNMSAFLGFSTVESLFGGANITERNFNIKGLRYIWKNGLRELRGGGEYAHLTATIGIKSRSYVFSWMKPYFMDTLWSVGFNLEKSITEYISKQYNIEAYGLNFNAVYQINAFLRQGYHYRLKHSRVLLEGDDISPDLLIASRRHSLVSAVGISYVYDSTNHPALPTCGFKSRLEAEIAGIGGEVRFVSLAYLNNYYYPLTKKSYLKFRGDARVLQPIAESNDKMPLDERLYLGGDTVVRGYRDYVLGPKFADGAAKGGLSMQLFTAEYNYQLNERIDIFAFFDAGSLTSNPWQVGRIYQAVGYGARVFILGNGGPPLTLGMGYPLNPKDDEDVKKFFLQVGGKF